MVRESHGTSFSPDAGLRSGAIVVVVAITGARVDVLCEVSDVEHALTITVARRSETRRFT